MQAFAQKEVKPKIGEAVDRIGLFRGLSEEQTRRLAGMFEILAFDKGETVFSRGEPSEQMYIVLSGTLAIHIDGAASPVGLVGPGECLGEVALLSEAVHSATAVAMEAVETGALTRAGLVELVRQRPDIGVVLYQNLARGLGDKLRRADLSHTT